MLYKFMLITGASMAVMATQLAGCDSGAEDVQQCSTSKPIIGGEVAPGLAPIGSLVEPSGVNACTGTLIAPNIVLTAAHCTEVSGSEDWVFAVGDRLSQAVSVTEIDSLHPQPNYAGFADRFDPGTGDDIALVVLDAPVPGVPTVNLSPRTPQVGDPYRVVGFGASNVGGQGGSGVRRAVTMPVIAVANKEVGLDASDGSTCFGDSGGPALDGSGNIVGVLSRGNSEVCNGGSDNRMIFTRVDAHRAFIDAVVADFAIGVGDGDDGGDGDGGPDADPDPPAPQDDCGRDPDGVCDEACPSADPDCEGGDSDGSIDVDPCA